MMMRAGEGTSRICAGCQLRHQCVAGHWLTVPSCSVQFSGMDGGAVGGTGGPHGVCHPTAQAFLSKTTSKSFKSFRSAWLWAASKRLSSTGLGSPRGVRAYLHVLGDVAEPGGAAALVPVDTILCATIKTEMTDD